MIGKITGSNIKALTFSSYTNLVFLNPHSMELLLDRILDRFMNDLRSL
ncbi:MAG: hypothetical protein JGK21_24290 [Microcoleus sp. PH2017_22_RUC_O_B]|nr:hypothetical protein [Microcoleus sp. PH2017_21_RUC_O_A]MCC3531063.1 hypothetical protein [Microcoleus sp. PH2017_21_RUC_O_A]MCC3543411.1 hypothetical protein [Microcoleus sp. PH2017_22_RUC_O_B]